MAMQDKDCLRRYERPPCSPFESFKATVGHEAQLVWIVQASAGDNSHQLVCKCPRDRFYVKLLRIQEALKGMNS
jgi:hypothetical protein